MSNWKRIGGVILLTMVLNGCAYLKGWGVEVKTPFLTVGVSTVDSSD